MFGEEWRGPATVMQTPAGCMCVCVCVGKEVEMSGKGRRKEGRKKRGEEYRKVKAMAVVKDHNEQGKVRVRMGR